jgi:hypothetical protein
MATEPIKVVAEILRTELGLKPDQVILYNQKFDIPSDDRLYLSLAVMGTKAFGVRNKHRSNAQSSGLDLEQGLNRQETYSILAYSRGPEARERNWEIPVALNSDIAQAAQEKNSMKIGNVPISMLDVSEVDGTARLNKYSVVIQVLVAYRKTTPVDFYDKFSQPVIHTNA